MPNWKKIDGDWVDKMIIQYQAKVDVYHSMKNKLDDDMFKSACADIGKLVLLKHIRDEQLKEL